MFWGCCCCCCGCTAWRPCLRCFAPAAVPPAGAPLPDATGLASVSHSHCISPPKGRAEVLTLTFDPGFDHQIGPPLMSDFGWAPILLACFGMVDC